MARRLGLLVLALTLGGFFFAYRNTSTVNHPQSSAMEQGQEPTVPDRHSAEKVEGTPSKSPAEQSRAQWEALLVKARNLGAADDAGLVDLYSQARSVIRADEAGFAKYLSGSVSELISVSFEQSFFTVSAAIRYSQTPTLILKALLQFVPPADPSDRDPHHEQLTPAVRHERLEAYGLRELRQQLDQGKIQLGDAERKDLVGLLLPRAVQEPSLNLTLEIFQLLTTLKERAAVEIALSNRSARDQKIIRKVVTAP